MAILVQVSEATAALRRMYFHCVDATDGITAEVGEAAGQPQISTNGGAWGNSNNTLTAIGNGRYYLELDAAEIGTNGIIEGRYKSAATAESVGTTLQIVPYDPYDAVRMGLTALPNANADAAGGLVISDAGGLDADLQYAGIVTNASGADVATDVAGIVASTTPINVALDTTLAVRTSETVFTMNAGHGTNDAYNNMVLALQDVTDSHWEVRRITDYAGATKTITVDSAFTFVVAANDVIKIFMNAYAPTVAAGGGATAAQVWDYDVSGVTTEGFAGTYQKIAGGRYG